MARGTHTPASQVDLEKGMEMAQIHEVSDPQKLRIWNPGAPTSIPQVWSREVWAGLCYCSVSVLMVLMNKAVLSSFNFSSPNSLLFFQCAMSYGLICGLRWMKWVKQEPFDMRIVRLWWPVNALFVGMIWSGFYSLKNLTVPMVTILKNTTNFIVLIGDWVVFGKRYGCGVWSAVILIMLSSLFGGITDLSFSWWGYTWQFVNCLFTASYSIYLKVVLEKICVMNGKSKAMEESTMVLYNNLLALPWVFVSMFLFGETTSIWKEPALHNPKFLLAALLSGLMAFSMSFASLLFLANTTPTIYSLVGSLNKVPLAILGMAFFSAPVTWPNLGSLGVGLSAGVMFAYAKSRSKT